MADSNKKKLHLFRGNGEPLFPVTYTDGVFNDENKSLTDIIDDSEQHQEVQDNRISNTESKNKSQDLDLKCLFTESKSQRVEIEEEGNSLYLQNSKEGFAIVDNIQGNTMVNCNKDTDKELILNGNIDTSGYGTVTTTEGVDGGKVDVALEGNTMVNVCDQEEPVAITKSYTVKTGNHIALQGEYDGKCRPNIYGNTLWIDNDTEKVLTAFDETKNLRLQSSFEDKLITDENDANNGKYKVDYKVTNKNKIGNSKLFLGYVSSSGALMSGNNNVRSDYIEIKSNTDYIGSTTNGFVDNINYSWFDSNKNFIKRDTSKIYVTSPINAKYVILHRATENDVSIEDLSTVHMQLEEGTTATTYEPYKETIKTLYLNSPLLEGDTIEQSGNNIIHNHKYGKVVLDGSDDEAWRLKKDDWVLDNSIVFAIFFPNGKGYNWGTYTGNESMSDRIPSYSDKYLLNNDVFGYTNDNITAFKYFRIPKSYLSTQDVDGFRKYLQENPITVVYELATPTQEIISTSDNLLLDSYTNGHLDVDSVIPIDKVEFGNTDIALKYVNANTEYIIQFESDNVGKVDIYNGSGLLRNINVTKGLNKVIITSDSNGYVGTNWSGIGFNASKIVVTPKVDNNFGYFKGMKSVGECENNKIEILSQNKNLINFTIDNIYNTDPSCTIKQEEDGATSIKASYNSPYWLKEGFFVEKGEKYSITIVGKKSSSEYSAMSFGGKNLNYYTSVDRWLVVAETSGNCITTIDNYGTYKTTATAKNTGYITRFFIHDSSGRNIYTIKNIQIEKADTPTDIVPYNSNKKEILLNEPLRGLPNGVNDKYVIIDGKWYIERNINKLKLNNEEINKVEFGDDIEGYSRWKSADLECLINNPVNGDYGSNKNILCSAYLSKAAWNVKNNVFIERNTLCLVIPNTYNTTNIYEYVNSLNIIYQLKTPTYEPLEIESTLNTYNDTTHISNNSNIPCNMVIRNSGFNCILKPNTTYTVSSNNGLSSVVTKDSIGDSVLRFYDKDTTSITKMSNVLVLEGDYVTGNPPIPAFFKGMESAFEQELVTDEKDEHYGKYKVNVKATNPDNRQENNITFYLNEPLRGVGNVKDKVYVKEDKVVVQRNCSSVTFDGSETDWKLEVEGNSSRFALYNITTINMGKNGAYLCATYYSYPYAYKYNSFHLMENGVRFNNDNHKFTTVSQWKQWLQQNPTTVVYQLATPVYEEVEYFDLKLFVEIFKDTTINYNSNIPVKSKVNYTFSVPVLDEVSTLSDTTDEQDLAIASLSYEQDMQSINTSGEE